MSFACVSVVTSKLTLVFITAKSFFNNSCRGKWHAHFVLCTVCVSVMFLKIIKKNGVFRIRGSKQLKVVRIFMKHTFPNFLKYSVLCHLVICDLGFGDVTDEGQFCV
jgi:hypothetical protein